VGFFWGRGAARPRRKDRSAGSGVLLAFASRFATQPSRFGQPAANHASTSARDQRAARLSRTGAGIRPVATRFQTCRVETPSSMATSTTVNAKRSDVS
jgi:hypothetical protein